MKKYTKRLVALLLACIMVLACGVTTFASGGAEGVAEIVIPAPNTWTNTQDTTKNGTNTRYTTYISKVTIPCKGTLKISMVSSDGAAYEDVDSQGYKLGLALYTRYGSDADPYDISNDFDPDQVFGFGGKTKATHEITLTKGTYYFSSTFGPKLKFKYTFTPAKTAVSSVKNTSSKAVSVKWKKVTGVTGYQIQYSTKSNFSSKKTVTVKKASTVSTVIRSLKKGKKYYVRVRTYTTINGVKCYSEWSVKKAVKIVK